MKDLRPGGVRRLLASLGLVLSLGFFALVQVAPSLEARDVIPPEVLANCVYNPVMSPTCVTHNGGRYDDRYCVGDASFCATCYSHPTDICITLWRDVEEAYDPWP